MSKGLHRGVGPNDFLLLASLFSRSSDTVNAQPSPFFYLHKTPTALSLVVGL